MKNFESEVNALYNRNIKNMRMEIMKVASFEVAGLFVPKYGVKWLRGKYGDIISKQNMRIIEEGLGVKVSVLSYAF